MLCVAVEKSLQLQKSVYLKDYERQRLLEKGRSVGPSCGHRIVTMTV